MTNINCSSNCIYQKEGKCCFEDVNKSIANQTNTNCAYFKPKEIENKK